MTGSITLARQQAPIVLNRSFCHDRRRARRVRATSIPSAWRVAKERALIGGPASGQAIAADRGRGGRSPSDPWPPATNRRAGCASCGANCPFLQGPNGASAVNSRPGWTSSVPVGRAAVWRSSPVSLFRVHPTGTSGSRGVADPGVCDDAGMSTRLHPAATGRVVLPDLKSGERRPVPRQASWSSRYRCSATRSSAAAGRGRASVLESLVHAGVAPRGRNSSMSQVRRSSVRALAACDRPWSPGSRSCCDLPAPGEHTDPDQSGWRS